MVTVGKPPPPRFSVLRFSEATVSVLLPIFLQPALRHLKLFGGSTDPFSKTCIIFIHKIDAECKTPQEWRSFVLFCIFKDMKRSPWFFVL